MRKIEKTREGMAQNKTEQKKVRNNRKGPETMRRHFKARDATTEQKTNGERRR